MRIIEDIKLAFKDVALMPKHSEVNSRKDVILEREFRTKHSNKILNGIPIIASNVYATGSFAMGRAMSKHMMYTALCKHHKLEDLFAFFEEDETTYDYNFFTIGTSIDDELKLKEFFHLYYKKYPEKNYCPLKICIDVANAYTTQSINRIKHTRNHFPTNVIMAGNVCTPEMTTELIMAGSDIVKVGIAQSQICITKNTTGITYPQWSVCVECSDAAHAIGGLICSDGSVKEPGDICKAMGAGADFVMCASLLSGVDENDGEWVCTKRPFTFEEYSEKTRKEYPIEKSKLTDLQYETMLKLNYRDFYPNNANEWHVFEKQSLKLFGMSSAEAMQKFGGWEKNYRAAEGICIEVPYKGSIEETLRQIEGGIRSCCTYIGAKRIKDIPKAATFIKVK